MSVQRLKAIRCLAALGLAAVCGCQPKAPIKIGFIGGLTGRLSDLAVDGRNGAQLAVETLSAQGGQRYELVVHDNRHEIAQGSAALEAAADEGDAFAIGPMTSVLAMALSEVANRRRFVLISPTASSDELSGRDDYFFRVITAAGPGAELLARAAIARGLKSAAVLADLRNRTFSESFAKAFARRFEALGGAMVATVPYHTDRDPDFAQLALHLVASRPRMILLVCGAVDASIAAQQVRRLDPEVMLATPSWAANVQLLQMGGRAVEGALVLQALDLDSKAPDYLDFVRRYQARFGTVPGQAAVYSYQAAMLGSEGLKKARGTQSLRDVLRVPGNWPGLQEPVVLDRFGDSESRFHLSEVRNGRFAMLPDAPAP